MYVCESKYFVDLRLDISIHLYRFGLGLNSRRSCYYAILCSVEVLDLIAKVPVEASRLANMLRSFGVLLVLELHIPPF